MAQYVNKQDTVPLIFWYIAVYHISQDPVYQSHAFYNSILTPAAVDMLELNGVNMSKAMLATQTL